MVCDLLVLLLWLQLDTQREKCLNESILNEFCSARSHFPFGICPHTVEFTLFYLKTKIIVSLLFFGESLISMWQKSCFGPSYFLPEKEEKFLFFTSAAMFVSAKRGFPCPRLILFSPVQLKSCFLTGGFRGTHNNPISARLWECGLCCTFSCVRWCFC